MQQQAKMARIMRYLFEDQVGAVGERYESLDYAQEIIWELLHDGKWDTSNQYGGE